MLGEFLLSLKTEEEKSRHEALPPIKTPACNKPKEASRTTANKARKVTTWMLIL